MTIEEVADIIRRNMAPELYAKPGAVLLSGANTLKPAPVYVMGLNPGGDPALIPKPIIDAIAPPNGTSGYTHDCWQPRCADPQPCRHVELDGTIRKDALVRHQRNMISLAGALGSTPASLFSANAVFARSTSRATLRQQSGLGLGEWWRTCWRIHHAFIAIVRPRIIVTLGYGEGSSAFGLLREQAGSPTVAKLTSPTERGGWCFDATLLAGSSLRATIIGAPHPSYFAPGPELTERLRSLISRS